MSMIRYAGLRQDLFLEEGDSRVIGSTGYVRRGKETVPAKLVELTEMEYVTWTYSFMGKQRKMTDYRIPGSLKLGAVVRWYGEEAITLSGPMLSLRPVTALSVEFLLPSGDFVSGAFMDHSEWTSWVELTDDGGAKVFVRQPKARTWDR